VTGEMVLLCGVLAWPVKLRGSNCTRPGRPTVIRTAAAVAVVKTNPFVTVVRWRGLLFRVPTDLLADPAQAFASLPRRPA
jgi:hypothetical protein